MIYLELISIVIPCYNEQDAIPIFYKEITKTAGAFPKEIDFEYLFIDDGSSDNTLKVVKELAEHDSRVKYFSFSRNFGKEAAIYAGLEHSKGDYVCTIDVDLQDPPHLLHEMCHSLQNEPYDCVATRRVSRKGEPPIRSFFAKAFYQLINKISKVEIVDGARDYRLMTRTMVNAILEVKECNRFSKGIFSWVGFRTKWIDYENVERSAGETKWSFWKLLLYSLDGIIAYSTVPLAIASILGILLCFLSFIYIITIVCKTLIWGDPVAGYPSLICIITFLGGIQLFCIGILGQYLSRTYIETKRRPIYLLREHND